MLVRLKKSIPLFPTKVHRYAKILVKLSLSYDKRDIQLWSVISFYLALVFRYSRVIHPVVQVNADSKSNKS